MPLLPALLLLGCSDYDVAHSELVAEAESAQLTLVADETGEVRVTMRADAAAMEAKPSSYLDLTVFAAQDAGSPRLYVTTAGEAVDSGVAPTAFLEVDVDEPFRACSGDAVEGAVVSVDDAGGCQVVLPVGLMVEGGTVSLQVTALVQLNFGRDQAPGELTLTVE